MSNHIRVMSTLCIVFFCLIFCICSFFFFFFFQAEDGIRDHCVTGVQTCALPIYLRWLVGKPGGELVAAEAPLLCCDPDVSADVAAWAAEDRLPAVAVVSVYSATSWEDDPLIVATARQCLAEGAGLMVRTSARNRVARPATEAVSDLGVAVALHDPLAA